MTLKRISLIAAAALLAAGSLMAQDDNGGSVRRRTGGRDRQERTQDGTVVTERMQAFYGDDNSTITDADRQWMRVIYRSIDLDKDRNAPLYFPEEPVEGQENLFRIILKQLAEGRVPAYEYLDGREVFTDQYKVNLRDVFDRFGIPYTSAKGSTEKNPKYSVDENDVPTNEVLSYFVVERWEFDTRRNKLRPVVEAICPVLHRSGDFGGDALKYPMFWVKFSDIRPYLAAQTIFVDDDNNLPTCSYDDFFTLNMYDGEIYKTRNLKNRSMVQMYSDPDDLKRAQDSIQGRLDHFEDKLWVPTREEVLAAKAKKDAKAAASEAATASEGDVSGAAASVEESAAPAEKEQKAKRSTKRSGKTSSKKYKEQKPKSSSGGSSSAVRSVRNRKK
ncbi:MAG: gliding motility protein GldN [Muribaculaceae bacterium]|nr:gliding motility protein GldN [Muribaculaceae bacterium]